MVPIHHCSRLVSLTPERRFLERLKVALGSNQGSHTIHNLTIDRRQMLRCAMAADGQSRDTDSLLFNLFAKAAQTGKVEDGDAAIVDLQQPGTFQFA